MPIIKRSTKGAPLTHAEMDGNWDEILQRATKSDTVLTSTLTVNTNALVVNSNKRVLIGTTTDNGTDLLQVNGSASVVGNVKVGGVNPLIHHTAVSGRLLLSGNVTGSVSSGGALILREATSPTTPGGLELWTGGAARITINNTGNIGIAGANAIYNINGASRLLLTGASDASSANGGAIALRDVASSYNACGVEFFAGGSERARITQSGSVLIGTDTDDGVNKLQVNGSVKVTGLVKAIVAKSANYTLTSADHTVTTTGNITITLPVASAHTGRVFVIKKMDSSSTTTTVDGNGAETIDGFASITLTAQYESVTIQSDGAQWLRI